MYDIETPNYNRAECVTLFLWCRDLSEAAFEGSGSVYTEAVRDFADTDCTSYTELWLTLEDLMNEVLDIYDAKAVA